MTRLVCYAVALLAFAPLPGCGPDDCNCRERALLPPEVENFALVAASRYDESGDGAPLLINPRGGTLRTEGDEVHIDYEVDGVEHHVVYQIVRD